MANAFVRYLDLGFSTGNATEILAQPKVSLPLGKRTAESRAWLWTLGAWLALSAGIFLRQAILLLQMNWNFTRLSIAQASVSAVVALALLPPAMRWLNRKRTKPGMSQILASFSLGFLVDLSAVATMRRL